jgi:hypothetical protein
MRKEIVALIPILALISVVFISGCVQQRIGGETDEHGCMLMAGYTWDENIGACARSWEVDENQARAAKLAVDHLGYEKGMTIIQVLTARCPGCYSVEVEKGKDRITVTIENWAIKGKSLTPEECEAKGGRTLNIVGGDTCDSNETNIGEVTGFISPNVCCLSKENACTDSGGTVSTGLCCLSTGDFPNSCLIGACGCAPTSSHEVETCDCGAGKCFDGDECVPEVWNFEDCINAGYPAMESYPRQCMTPDGRSFTEEDICVTSNGVSMSLFEAKQVAMASDCVENGTLTDTGICNSDTGTWWIDLDIEKTGCSPACVVDIEAKTGEINWRCTGLI